MKVKERKGWKQLDTDLENYWYNSEFKLATWTQQKKWLSKELVKRNFVKQKQLKTMWFIFEELTDSCSRWPFQSKVLSFITLCLDKEIGEDLHLLIK